MAQDFIQCWMNAIATLEESERQRIIKLLKEIEDRGTGSGSNALLTALCQAEKQLLGKIAYLNQLLNDAQNAVNALNALLVNNYCPEVSTLITVINGSAAIATLDLLDQQRSLTGLQIPMASLNGKVTIGESLGSQAAHFRDLMQTF